VVSLDCLAALDCLQWLRTGLRAAESLERHQSSIAHDARKCQQIFRIRLTKQAEEWRVIGDDQLLAAERHLHQKYRWDRDLSLRLDAQHWLRDSYSPLQLAGWTKGNMNYLEYSQPLYLIQNRIIDAWLCSAPDQPKHPELTARQLCSMPSYLVVKKEHPLVALGSSASLADVRRYPLLPLPSQSFPVFEAMIASLGLNNSVQPPGDCSLPIEDLLIGIASPLTISLYGPDYVALPVEIPVSVGDVLVVRTEYADHPRTTRLLEDLLSHLHSIGAGNTNIRVLDKAPSADTSSASASIQAVLTEEIRRS